MNDSGPPKDKGGSTQSGELVPAEVVREVEKTLQQAAGKKLPPASVALSLVRTVQTHIDESFSGPLPPPRHLREYDEIVPGAGREIIDMTREEQKHRHAIEQRLVGIESRNSLLGINAGWTICAGFLLGAIYLGSLGQVAVPIAFVGVSLAGIVGKLMGGWRPPPDDAESPKAGKAKGPKRKG